MDKEERAAIMKARKKRQTARSEKNRVRTAPAWRPRSSQRRRVIFAGADGDRAKPTACEPAASLVGRVSPGRRRAACSTQQLPAPASLTPVAGPIRQADVIPFGHEGTAGVDCRLLAESACSGAMHVRRQLREYGMCGSMLGPGPFIAETEQDLQGWAAGRLRRWSL